MTLFTIHDLRKIFPDATARQMADYAKTNLYSVGKRRIPGTSQESNQYPLEESIKLLRSKLITPHNPKSSSLTNAQWKVADTFYENLKTLAVDMGVVL